MSDLPQLAHDAPAPAPYKPNAILGWLYRRFFAHIHVDENWSRGVRDAASKGVVVYVMRSLSFLDFLCLDFLLKKFGLPLVRFVNDLGLWILEPFGKGERRLSLRRQIPESEALQQTIGEGFSALLFLRRPPKFGRRARRGRNLDIDLIENLVQRPSGNESGPRLCHARIERHGGQMPHAILRRLVVIIKVPGNIVHQPRMREHYPFGFSCGTRSV